VAEMAVLGAQFDSPQAHAALYSALGFQQSEEVTMSTTARTSDNEVTILARVFDDERGLLPRDLARALLGVEFSERDKARMHDLAVRNQDDALSSEEKEELFAFAKAGSLLGILKSKARRTLKIKPKKRTLA
jgi:hypothetical protein